MIYDSEEYKAAVDDAVAVAKSRRHDDGDFEGLLDMVNHPPHYAQYEGFEVIDITEQLNFNTGNIVKYALRAGSKGDFAQHVEDLRKVVWYAEREIGRISE